MGRKRIDHRASQETKMKRYIIMGLAVAVGAAAASGAIAWQGASRASTCARPDLSAVAVRGGSFQMGAGADDDTLIRQVSVGDFSIDRYAVTNGQFAAFVAAT